MEKRKSLLNNINMLVCLLLILVNLVIYWQAQYHDFIHYDDTFYITENDWIKSGLSWKSFLRSFNDITPGYWHPLSWLSHTLDWELFRANAGGHHWTNVIFHIANTLLIFLVLKHMTKQVWRSAFVALLFAVHPLNVESVEWIAERKNILSMFFGLLTIGAYSYYAERPTLKRYSLIVLLFSLGLMAKPILVTLPIVLLLLDYWPLKRIVYERIGSTIKFKTVQPLFKYFRSSNPFYLILEKVPLLILSGIISVVTFITARQEGAVASLSILPINVRVANAFISYVKYIIKMFWPQNLAVFYPYPESPPKLQIIGAVMILVLITLLAIKCARHRPFIVVGWSWYLFTLLPVIGLVQAGQQAMADRYTYWSFIGLFILVVWGIPEFLTRWPYRRILLIIGASVLISTLMAKSFMQAKFWQSSVSLFQNAIEVTSGNYPAHNNIGVALMEKGSLEEAIEHFREALQIQPTDAKGHNNLGMALAKQHKLAEAIIHYTVSLQIKPSYAEAHNNIGVALMEKGNLEEAIEHFREVLQIKPNDAKGHNNLGMALAKQHKLAEAIIHYKVTLKLKPDYAYAYNNLGTALANQGDLDGAITYLKKAIILKPDYAYAYNNLGMALARQGDLDGATTYFNMALRIKPDYSNAREGLQIIENALKYGSKDSNHVSK